MKQQEKSSRRIEGINDSFVTPELKHLHEKAQMLHAHTEKKTTVFHGTMLPY